MLYCKDQTKEFHKVAGLDLPDWIEMVSDGNDFEDAVIEEEEIIRGFFMKKINDTFAKNYKSHGFVGRPKR